MTAHSSQDPLSVPGATMAFPTPEGTAMTTTATAIPDVPLPAGARQVGGWDPGRIMDADETRDWRLIFGADRKITDGTAYVHLRATQYADGSLEDLGVTVYTADDDLSSDQARELAAVLLEAAAELDGWARR
jgi:hypothetical protein